MSAPRIHLGGRQGGRRRGNCRQGGFALIAVLWVVVVASLILVGVQKGSQVELAAAYGELSAVQAHWMARAGVERAISLLAADAARGGCDSMRDDWFDNADAFDIDLSLGACCVVAPMEPAARSAVPYRLGLTDLSSRVNANTADEDQLGRLGHLTGGQINTILDWRDGDDNERPAGAEQNYYDSLSYPYLARNGPLKTVGELRLVRGIDEATFFGRDGNDESLGDPGTRLMRRRRGSDDDVAGLCDRLTVHSCEPNLDAAGQKRVNVNSADVQMLKSRFDFSDALAQGFVGHTAAKGRSSEEGGPSGGPARSSGQADKSSGASASSPGGAPGPGGDQQGKKAAARFTSLFGLLEVQPAKTEGSSASSPGSSSGGSSSASSSGGKVERIDMDWLAQHWDELTLSDDERITGRINVNTAPPGILMSLPDMTEAIVDAICQRREGPKGPFLSVGELYAGKTLSQDQFKHVAERVCVRSSAFEVRAIATTRLGVQRQIVAVVDRGTKPVSILYWYQGE